MKVGLIGLPSVGKSTLFHLLTGNHPTGADKKKTATGVAKVPDPRVDALNELYHPKKTTYAALSVVEVPGFIPDSFAGDNGAKAPKGLDPKSFVDALRDVDALLHVVRAFDDPSVPHVHGDIDPARDLAALASELLLTDWQLMQTRLERLQSAKKRQPNHDKEVAALGKAADALESETPLYALDLTKEEKDALSGYTFFTDKPALVAVNLGDAQLANGDYPGQERIASIAATMDAPVTAFAAAVEAEISELDPADRRAFMADLGIETSGIQRLARAAYERLGLISYFTVGEDEVRAWTIRKGSDAKSAAAAIHSDIARGFIRAEVAEYQELVDLGGWQALKEKGRVRLEGKEYTVQNGDVMNFRFNV